MRILTLGGKWLLFMVALFWVTVLGMGTQMYLSFKSDIGFLQLKQAAVKTGWYLPAFYMHIFGASVILLIGLIQLMPVKQFYSSIHKLLGKIYVFGVLLFSAPGGFVMTFFINRGPGVFASFLIQNMLWVIFTLSAWIVIKSGNIDAHVKMMRRSYALAFAAVTLRFYIWMCHVFGHGVDFEYNYLIIAFASWVPNLIVAELVNRYGKKPTVLMVK